MTLIGYGIFSDIKGDAIKTGGYGGTSHSSKIYKHRAMAINIARKKKDCHVKELYVRDFNDMIQDYADGKTVKTGVVFP